MLSSLAQKGLQLSLFLAWSGMFQPDMACPGLVRATLAWPKPKEGLKYNGQLDLA